MNEDIQEVLDELHTVRPEMLDEKGKRLFEAIMKIADERDEYKQEIERLKGALQTHEILLKSNVLEIERLKEELEKEKYLVDKYTRQLTDEYKNTEYQCKEKERLNNIINELEKYLIEDNYKNEDVWCITTQEVLNKLQELKGSESNE